LPFNYKRKGVSKEEVLETELNRTVFPEVRNTQANPLMEMHASQALAPSLLKS
jgi:hypothetical protein